MNDQGNREVPNDGQTGDPLGQPARFKTESGRRPTRIAAVGCEPRGYMVRAILHEIFSYPNVHLSPSIQDTRLPVPDTAVVIENSAGPALSWEAFSDWLGPRYAVLDIGVMVAIAGASGFKLSTAQEKGKTTGALQVFHRRMSAPIYPQAPRVRIQHEAHVTAGFGVGDEFQLYHPSSDSPKVLALNGIVQDAPFSKFVKALDAVVCGVSAKSEHAALLSLTTKRGGKVGVFDLGSVNRLPEPAGVESLASQLFLNGIGIGRVVFGKFLRAYANYDEMIAVLQGLAEQYPDFCMLYPAGKSEAGRKIWMLKIFQQGEHPAVLLSSTIHPLEWGPVYGVLRYIHCLLENCRHNTPYAREALNNRQLWWIPSLCPDGWESRDQQANGINLVRNFPGSWELCQEGGVYWDTYNRRFAPVDPDPHTARGPSPGSQPETRALMNILDEKKQLLLYGDFHETTAPDSFLHQEEDEEGRVWHAEYHHELIEGIADSFNGRFYAHANRMAYRPGLNDFSTYTFRCLQAERRFVNGAGTAGTIRYASDRGLRATVVEAAGSDCTHFQTIRRTEYAALTAEQLLFSDNGRILRNPYGEDTSLKVSLYRCPPHVDCRIFDTGGMLVEKSAESSPASIRRTVPAGGWMILRFQP